MFLFLFLVLHLTVASRPITVIAHRGSSGDRPEETISAYERASIVGADYLESDLCATKDHELVLVHDCELEDTTNVGQIPAFRDRLRFSSYFNRTGYWTEDFNLSEIQTLRCFQRLASRPQHFNSIYSILSVDEYLQLVWGLSNEAGRAFGVYIETKHPKHFREIGLPLEQVLIDALEHYSEQGGRKSCGSSQSLCRVILQSFDESSLKLLKTLAPEIPRVFLVDRLGGVILENVATFANGIGPNALHISKEWVSEAHHNGLVVHPWTLRQEVQYLPSGLTFEQTLTSYMDMGIDGIFSDHPERVIAHLADKSFKPDWSFGLLVASVVIGSVILLVVLLKESLRSTAVDPLRANILPVSQEPLLADPSLK